MFKSYDRVAAKAEHRRATVAWAQATERHPPLGDSSQQLRNNPNQQL
jgi:hypothetical protein